LKIFGTTDVNIHQAGIQPIIAVDEFQFGAGILDLLRTPMRVHRVYLKGLQLNIPPKGQRGEGGNLRSRKIKIYVDAFDCEKAQLIINTVVPGKLPLEFDISKLDMQKIGPGQPLRFTATLVNPKPVGDIQSSGFFGPWQADDPRSTPVRGDYSFSNADLSTIKGIGGILASVGRYDGTLGNIVVDGETSTPDFRIAITGHPVPLTTKFHAIVDGTSGDTYLEPVQAKILNSSLVDIPPGEADVSKRLQLAGNFQISQAHFTNEKIQSKLDVLSTRGQGRPKEAKGDIPDVPSLLSGTYNLSNGLLSFSKLHFQMPGTRVDLSGKYSLDGFQFDFRGKARMDAKLSHMVTGWKSVLLKPVDPFFSKPGAGTEIPVKVTGTKSEPHFGVDFGHKN
jgi:hypothetical protein